MAPRGARRRLCAAAGSALAMTFLASGCTDDSRGDGAPSPAPVALRLSLVAGAQELNQRERVVVEDEIGDVLSSYVVEGFLGSFPRTNFVRAFDSFTIGVVDAAARDVSVLTAAHFRDANAVRAEKLVARISCLVTGGEAVGATAHVNFGFEVDLDGNTQQMTLRGRLLLTREEGVWSVFGYDLKRQDQDGGSA